MAKALLNCECDVLKWDFTPEFYIELGKFVGDDEYKFERTPLSREHYKLLVKLFDDRYIEVKPYSYLIIKDKKILGYLDEGLAKSLLKFFKED